ncbi:multifunctional oxoglutarate decarboxylase/oxoglutarate dehydrogenase thiamine pyrophosphate-binding subunit/dihydrolipoyllysine-residue succinyltransferase subunit [soil metagenome]
MADTQNPTDALGPNAWLVDEMYEQFLDDPKSVSESWRDFFADYQRDSDVTASVTDKALPATGRTGDTSQTEAVKPNQPPPEAKAKPKPHPDTDKGDKATDAKADDQAPAGTGISADGTAEIPGEPLRGAAARIVTNMEASLDVPTATSFREVPAKLLEVNRRIINGYLTRTRGGKISFTHLIGYAIVRAVADTVPAMNSAYLEGPDGKPRVIRNEHVGLGLAVDVEKRDGSRTLLVPVIKGADTLDFRGFWGAYEDLIRKVRSNKLAPDDFSGASITLTNPGTIGTVQSVPRLMPGQGVIVGVGRLDYPAAFGGSDPQALAEFGLSKVMTVTSTYDHRIIQGAESGLFLKRMQELLMGEDDFYGQIFRALGVPYTAVEWLSDDNPVDKEQARLEKQMHAQTLVNQHRVRGHLIADLDPLAWKEPQMHPELDPATYGLTIWDLDREFLTGGVGGKDRMKLGDLLHVLRDAYCRTIGIEYMHISEPEQKRWIQEHVEGVPDTLDAEEQRHVLGRLNAAEAFEKFLATKYVGQKRFGIEGAESAIPILDAVLEAAAADGLDGSVMGMAHRGRLNVLANIVGKNFDQLFREFEGYIDPDSTQGSGDVKYHLGQTGTFTSRHGQTIPVELAANPSHLEAVNPIVEGMVRARQDIIDDPEAFSVLPLLLHGDAAFAGQGVVAETLNCSTIKGYRVGGTIHLIINNQLGFTTSPDSARSSEYSTDIAKMIEAPIFHVNGDDPEACVRVARLAYAFRQTFHKDVIIDMVCYRRHGHNEGDDPSYTQPLMYKRIDARRSVRKIFTETLVKRGDISITDAEQALDDFSGRLGTALTETRESKPTSEIIARPMPPAVGVLPHVETGVAQDTLDRIYATLSSASDGFEIHPKLAKQFETRTEMVEGGQVDWATAEAMAFGSLLLEGTDIRFAGQDSRRGTFSQRHSVLSCYGTGEEYAPLANLATEQGKFWIYDSLLSEYAAMGFEYGYSVANPDALVCWEAQFGDFVNGAMIVIDQYLVAAEDKWGQTSGLVLLLPHGLEGQGPEHSSGRIERFLTLCAEDNIQVANATTAAQYFHLLRRQMRREVRKPLVVMTPKSLLRNKASRSPMSELTAGSFRELLDDPSVADPASVERLVFCSGKVAYDAMSRRDEKGFAAGVIRLEQLYPFPYKQVGELLTAYPNLQEVVWLQEEPDNMGPRSFVNERLWPLVPEGIKYRQVSRSGSGSPATGSHGIHVQEQSQLLDQTFEGM